MDPRQRLLLRENRLRLAAVLSVLAFAILILAKVDNMLVSSLLAFVIAYLFKPIVVYFERLGLSRTVAILIPFSVVTISFIVAIQILTPVLTDQFNSFVTEFPKYVDGLTKGIKQSEARLNSLFTRYELNVSERVGQYLQDNLTIFLQMLPSYASRLFTTLLLAPFFAFFMLRDGRTFSRTMLALVPNSLFELALSISHQVNEQLGGFIRARLLEAAIVGTAVFCGLFVIGFPYAAFLALFAALTNLIPYIGPIIGAVPALLIAFINKDSSLTVLLLTSVYMIAQLIDIFFIIPMVVAKIVNLHPVTVVIVIILGSHVGGILGMIISIPVTSALKITFTNLYDHLVRFRA